jgi:hypothetical protein
MIPKSMKVLKGTFLVSVTLIEISNKVSALGGIKKTYVLYGTALNKKLLAD